jgi:hypothetical protein
VLDGLVQRSAPDFRRALGETGPMNATGNAASA